MLGLPRDKIVIFLGSIKKGALIHRNFLRCICIFRRLIFVVIAFAVCGAALADDLIGQAVVIDGILSKFTASA